MSNSIFLGDNLTFLKENNNLFNLVMIDPPYNEDKSKGLYQDSWVGKSDMFPWAGKEHGAYLDFLYPRLNLAKEKLTEDGCIMLFIGDSEYHRIRILMDMIFDEDNYLGTICWDSNSNSQQSKKINRTHEYVIIFAKNIKCFKGLYSNPHTDKDDLQNFVNSISELNYSDRCHQYEAFLTEKVNSLKKENDNRYKDIMKYKYIMPDSNIIFRDNSSSDPRNGTKEPLLHPVSGLPCSIPTKGFRFSVKYINELNSITAFYELPNGKYLKILKNNNSKAIMGVIFGSTNSNVPQCARVHLPELNKVVLKTTGFSFSSKNKKSGIPSGSSFETVKPFDFLSELIQNYPNKNASILDFFGGSGTTAIATDNANKKDGGQRTWTLIEYNKDTLVNTMIPRLDFFNISDYSVY